MCREVNNPSAVFDSAPDGFINAGIRWRKQSEDGGLPYGAALCILSPR